MRIAVMADVGHPVYHVGDEAMALAACRELGRRALRPVLLTRDLEHSRGHFGQVDLAETIRFPWPPEDRERYLSEIERVLAGDLSALPPHDQIHRFVEMLRSCDALLVAGGGNLNSRFGWLMYERAAAAKVASHLGIPVVVSGQTIGPSLTEHDRGVLADLLRAASLVGLREAGSLALARELAPDHPALHPCLDDASFLDAVDPPDTSEPVVVGTFTSETGAVEPDEAARLIGTALHELSEASGARVVLVPHMATPGSGDGDEEMHRQVAAQLAPGRVDVRGVDRADVAADRFRGAELVVSSRYHPAVFAMGAGAAFVGLAPDEYTDTRLAGALGNWGLAAEHVLPLPAVADPEFAGALLAAWDTRHDQRGRLESRRPQLRAVHDAWWDVVAQALRGEAFSAALPPRFAEHPAPELLRRLNARHRHYLRLTGRLSDAVLELERSRGTAARPTALAPPTRTPLVGAVRRLLRPAARAVRSIRRRASSRGGASRP